MRKLFCGVLAAALVGGLVGNAQAHIDTPGNPFLFFEMTDSELAAIDIEDGTLDDWRDLYGVPSLVPTDFQGLGGDVPEYDPASLDFEIFFGWTRESRGNHMYCAIERVDDVYYNEYEGGNPSDFWRYDSIEFYIDGDHSGGQYNDFDDVTEEENKLLVNSQAQQYLGIAETPDGQHIGYLGFATEWILHPPYADGGGAAVGSDPNVSAIEFYFTPFDDVTWNDPEASVPTSLQANAIVGFGFLVPDLDTSEPYTTTFNLTGQSRSFVFAERFTDGLLVPSDDPDPTAVKESSWAQVKASFQD